MNEQTRQRSEILINGGGMVGLALALGLARTGFPVTVLDALPLPPATDSLRASLSAPAFDSRVSAITAASRRWLEQLGVWEALAGLRICAYRDMCVWDADGTGAIHFSAEEVHADNLGHIVENRLLCAVLLDALRQAPQARVCHGHTLTAIRLHAEPAHQTEVDCANGAGFACRLLIGADGGHSQVRQLCGFATREWSYGQQAIACTIRTAQPHQFTAWQRFMDTGPLAILPLYLPTTDEQHYSSIVWSCDEVRAAALMALPQPQFEQQLQQAFEHRLGAMEVVTPRAMFPLQQQHATDYARAGVVLVGDAAHTIHPLAGQGVNLGLADAACLVRV
ncbi:MAG TPA: FAD-dependent monooxygenase, partial [Candidatus Acidoferrum sp.]|nr:FAD-dependent monooxygenase [Candidatus Acidoferrum sp.]